MRCIRVPSLFLLIFSLLLSYGIVANAQTSATNTFATNLSLGSSGSQVLALQKILNQDPTTSIAASGPGSSGNETAYFGLLTRAAVIRFQQKYANEVLAPAGLTQASGFVGLYTRSKLNALSVSPVTGSIYLQTPTPPPTTAPVTTVTPPSQNPNQKNLGLYIAAIHATGLKQGMSASTLSLIENKIRADAATTTDFTQQFFDTQKALYEKKITEETFHSPVLAFFEETLSFVAEPFYATKAYAATGLPFGGYVTDVDPEICDCSPGITQLFVELNNAAPPQVSNLLLNYVDGSEGFSNHNIPEPTIASVGEYTPGVLSCLFNVVDGCIPVPAEGQIMPLVGSSLAP